MALAGGLVVILEALQEGGVVVFPTANTYGLLADASREVAVEQIYELKGRDRSKPLGYLSSPQRAEVVGVFTERSRPALQLWPGPLSIIVPKAPSVPYYVTPLSSVLLVCPDQMTCEVVDAASFPIACTSANLSGQPAITDFSQACSIFDGKVSLILDGGASLHGSNGSILDYSVDPPKILRLGPYPVEELRKLAPDLVLADQLLPN